MLSFTSRWQTTLLTIQVIIGLPSCTSLPCSTSASNCFIGSLMVCTVWRYSTIGAPSSSMWLISWVACHGSQAISLISSVETSARISSSIWSKSITSPSVTFRWPPRRQPSYWLLRPCSTARSGSQKVGISR